MTRRQQLVALLASGGALVVVAAVIGFALGGGSSSEGTDLETAGGAQPSALPSPGATTADGGSSDADAGDGGGGTGEDGTGDGGAGDGGDGACASDGFQVGDWDVPGADDPGTVSGITVTGDEWCARLRIRFDGPVPAVRVYSPSMANHTSVSWDAGDGGQWVPTGPIDPDLLQPRLEVLRSAMLTSDGSSLSAKALHGRHNDVATRTVASDQHVDVYFRLAQPDDPRIEDRWLGGPRNVQVRGLPDQGLVVLRAAGYDGETVFVQGYAKAPESNVVVRVHEADGDAVICDNHQIALGPPYLFSYFAQPCRVPRTGSYDVQVGWPSPAGEDGVWRWYEVRVD